jgi:Tfp pilus assembly protein FimT
MSTNETVLIIVTAIAALVLVAVLVGFAHKTRSREHRAFGGSIREEVKAEALQAARSDARARQQLTADEANE